MPGLSRGNQALPQSATSTPYWRPEKVGKNKVFILNPSLETVITMGKFQLFATKDPFTASWGDIGKSDVGYELGLKPSPKAFLWIAILEDGEWVRKVWECTGPQFSTVAKMVNEFGLDLQGMMLIVEKNKQGRWELNANRPPAKQAVPADEVAVLWQEVVDAGLDGSTDNRDVYRMVGFLPTVPEEKAFLIKKADVANWNQVRAKFGLEPVEDDEVEADEPLTEDLE